MDAGREAASPGRPRAAIRAKEKGPVRFPQPGARFASLDFAVIRSSKACQGVRTLEENPSTFAPCPLDTSKRGKASGGECAASIKGSAWRFRRGSPTVRLAFQCGRPAASPQTAGWGPKSRREPSCRDNQKNTF